VIINGIEAIIAMGAGHRPEKEYLRDKQDPDVRHAREKVQAGRGEQKRSIWI